MYTFCRSLTSIDLNLFVQIRSTLRIDCSSQTKNFSSTIIGTQKYLLGTNKSFNHTLFAVKTFNTMWKDFPLLEFCLLDILFEFVSWNNPFCILCPWIYFFFLISWFQYIVHMPLMLMLIFILSEWRTYEQVGPRNPRDRTSWQKSGQRNYLLRVRRFGTCDRTDFSLRLYPVMYKQTNLTLLCLNVGAFERFIINSRWFRFD